MTSRSPVKAVGFGTMTMVIRVARDPDADVTCNSEQLRARFDAQP